MADLPGAEWGGRRRTRWARDTAARPTGGFRVRLVWAQRMSLRALIFDVDGTLADTEECHRQAFNAAFRAHGLDWDWNPTLYRDLLWIAGGKERIRHYIESLGAPDSQTSRWMGMLADIHRVKTERYVALVRKGQVALRPGVERLIDEARAAGLSLAVASTTTAANLQALIASTLGNQACTWFAVIATGDVVQRKKPAPDVYHLAVDRLGIAPAQGVAFEDSALGVQAAKGTGLFTVAAPTRWTASHDLSAADLVLPSLGDEAHPLDAEAASAIGAPWLTLEALIALHERRVLFTGPGLHSGEST